MLDGDRISYRTLDVEQIGSVYETIMGFRMEIATGPSVAVKPAKKLGAPSTVDLDALLAQPRGDRARWLKARADRNVTDTVAKGLRAARTVDDLHAALDRMLDKDATPDLVPPGALALQPNEERRRSGSHYTPRELTEPIVRHALAPVLDRLRGEDGRAPTPAQILDLKVCDPAMGSGAFLVETCRQLADALVDAWGAHGEMPVIPPDEDEVIHARRLVAQRCLYGIDRNPTAVDLAKVSLWLSTLARDHPLTFVDHAFRHGDSLVGLSRRQIEAFHWLPDTQPLQAGFEVMRVREHVAKAAALRRRIREAGEEVSDRERHDLWRDARDELAAVRLFGDLALAAFFAEAKPKQREAKRLEFADAVVDGEAIRYLSWLEERRHGNPPLAPFHWEIELPEVFDRENPGFDAFVGNPPFAGKNALAAGNVAHYPDWLKTLHEGSHGNADLVAHFYRRAFNLVRDGGALGLIATNTIAQGDTRSSGLRRICEYGGEIYRATRRVKWPGEAAVVVSVLHIARGGYAGGKVLDGANVGTITAFLFHQGGHADPARLAANAGKSFQGSIVLGMGFTFDDTDTQGVASPLAEMRRLIEDNPRNREAILPYIGGEEVNTSPIHAHHRYVINFRDYPLRREAVGESWEDIGESREAVGESRDPGESEDAEESWAGTDNQRRRYPLRREREGVGESRDPGESEDVGESWAGADDQRRRYPSRREREDFGESWDPGESEDVGESWAGADDQRHRYPLRREREDFGESWAEADEERRRELRRQPMVPHDYPEPVAADWPELLAIVEERVKPERDVQNRKALRERWWHYAEKRPGLYATVAGLERVLVINCGATPHHAFTRLPSRMVFANTLAVLPFDTHAAFCTLQSRPHEIWSRFFGSSLEDRLRYTPSDCFETFPFPEGWETHPGLEAAGKAYYDFRAALMVRNDEGMTKTYNRFHDPYETASDIAELRDLHTAMDRAVLDAYGWDDLPTDCDFLLDHEIDEATWGRKKKPYRYRWPDAVRDEVLARLLALNAERAAEEARAEAATQPPKPTSTRSRSRVTSPSSPPMVAEPKSLRPLPER